MLTDCPKARASCLAIEDGEAGGDGAVEQIRLREAEHEAALQVAELRGEGQSFAEAQEVVGLIGKANEGACQSADATLQADGLLALFLKLEIEIDGPFFGIALDLDGLIFLNALEVVQLVETQNAELPEALVEKLAFVEQQLAANDFVAGGGVAAEVDATNVVLLLLGKPHGNVNTFGGVINIEARLGGEVDESVLAVGFAVVFDRLADLCGRKDVALMEREEGFQRFNLK